ncbi:MAG TPA: YdeI/OmpD-associated family protein [Intrasporangium sp.]|uniref:YdeI/OmpD-associated family protein n=1 Tax=Intrasporangium sp. TaxID=1925024 RepID=UPI002D787782|nr:YdeI/OmpD-associated family protein [Intrasporangium sp.]HET7397584.1 YdeI/OmpD-associated family protein [Intrasporangium sp.]
MHLGGTPERPATFFDDLADFREWLECNAATASELWMGLRKKHVRPRGLTWEDAVTEALRFGWIDSQVQRIDDDAVRQRWTPRKPGSTWSRINIEAVERLRAEGRMRPEGLAAYARRREDRSAIYAYEQGDQVWPAEYEALLRSDARAASFWDGATASYRKVCTHWVLSAKQPATRDKRMAELVEDCAALRLIKSQRYGTEPGWVARLRTELG